VERLTYKKIQNFLLFFTISVLALVLIIEYENSLEPCPLCIMQRMSAFIMGFLCFAGLGLTSLRRVSINLMLQILFAVLGVYFSARQLWLQSLPFGEGQLCIPGMDAVQKYVTLSNFLKTYFWGAADCAEVTWRGLGLSMPAWALLYFVIMIVANMSLFVFLKQKLDTLEK